jgi:prepilin-type N-terminal cleavage/methylation domain-containing protein
VAIRSTKGTIFSRLCVKTKHKIRIDEFRLNSRGVKSGGFTLVEVMAAMLLIALIMPVAMKGVSLAVSLSSQTRNRLAALEVAENTLAMALIEQSWQSGESAGTERRINTEYSWQIYASDYELENVKLVEVVVEWQQRNRTQQISLSRFFYER